jgi:hypothetical protein
MFSAERHDLRYLNGDAQLSAAQWMRLRSGLSRDPSATIADD